MRACLRFGIRLLIVCGSLAVAGCGSGSNDPGPTPSPSSTSLAGCIPDPSFDRCTRHDECGPGGECQPIAFPEGACLCAFGGACVFRELIQDCAGVCDELGVPCVSEYDLNPANGDRHACLCAIPEPRCDRAAGGCAADADCREADGRCVPFALDDPFFCTCRFTGACRYRPERGFCEGSCGIASNCISAADLSPFGDPEQCTCEPPTPMPDRVATPDPMSTP